MLLNINTPIPIIIVIIAIAIIYNGVSIRYSRYDITAIIKIRKNEIITTIKVKIISNIIPFIFIILIFLK